ncbi:anion transporter [Planctomicrobium sp. SH527]|uniref:anion transporter n=1 Tax=Planctomicrobium sp. SH527 TaxID=3448123 RepID=UPI003F5C8E75
MTGAVQYWGTICLFVITYIGLATGRLPGLRIDRAGIALCGAAAMLCGGFITLKDAAQAIDPDTIILLLGMMIVVASLQLSGFFSWMTDVVIARCKGPYSLLAMVILLSGGLSALLVNDVVCVALTPLVLSLCLRTGRTPLPYLIALATSSNIGSVATETGNPQNIIIASLSGIPYFHFAARLSPVAIMGLAVNFLLIAAIYRKELAAIAVPPTSLPESSTVRLGRPHRQLMMRSLIVTTITVFMFFAGYQIAVVALGAAAVMLCTGVRTSKFYQRIDWPLLLMFGGLFIVVRTFEVNVVHSWKIDEIASRFESPILVVTGMSVVLSNLVSNVPAVLLFRSLIPSLDDPVTGWLALAMSSTLAGNLTLLGSVANLIVVETARREGIIVGFFEYLKVGIILTVLTTTIGVLWLMWT